MSNIDWNPFDSPNTGAIVTATAGLVSLVSPVAGAGILTGAAALKTALSGAPGTPPPPPPPPPPPKPVATSVAPDWTKYALIAGAILLLVLLFFWMR